MLYRLAVLGCVAAIGLAGRAWALPPRQAAVPLSRILQALEQQGDVAYFKEIEWDDIRYWEIEYQDKDGRKVELKVDPVTGETRRR